MTNVDILTEIIIDQYVDPTFDRLIAGGPEMLDGPTEHPEDARLQVEETIEKREPLDPEQEPLATEAREYAMDRVDWHRIMVALNCRIENHLEGERREAFADPV